MIQINKYQTFIDKGKIPKLSDEYTKIKVNFIDAVKHDGRYKARLVARGHLTAIPDDGISSGVVSLKGIRLITFLGKLNNLPIYSIDNENAYLETVYLFRISIIYNKAIFIT